MSEKLSIETVHEYVIDRIKCIVKHTEYKVVKETVTTLILENGQRVRGSEIIDFDKSDYRSIVRRLTDYGSDRVMSLRPITREEAKEIKAYLVNYAKMQIESLACTLKRNTDRIKTLQEENERIEKKDLVEAKEILRRLKSEK